MPEEDITPKLNNSTAPASALKPPKNYLGMIITSLIVLGVVAGDIWILQNLISPEIAVAPDAGVTPSNQIPNGTENWKTYINEEHKFEVKYPAGWIVKNDNSNSFLAETKADDNNHLFFGISFNRNADVARYSIISAENIILGGNTAYKYFFQEGVGVSGVVVMQMGKDVITLDLLYLTSDGSNFDKKRLSVEKVLDQILSTFKFIE